MKHLKAAASVVNLAIFVSCSISCSSVPPPPAGAAGYAMLAPHLPGAGWGSPAGVGLINQLAGTHASQRAPATH
jgi:hypothetical protein